LRETLGAFCPQPWRALTRAAREVGAGLGDIQCPRVALGELDQQFGVHPPRQLVAHETRIDVLLHEREIVESRVVLASP
jgi:hypothetical protein